MVRARSHTSEKPGDACLRTTELLLVDDQAQRGGHPGALYRRNAPVGFAVSTTSPMLVLTSLPEAPERLAKERRRHALLAPRTTREKHLNPAATVGLPVQIVPAASSSPARTTHQSAASKRSLPRCSFDHGSKACGVYSQ